MFNNYKYEKPAFIAKKSTDALTAAFAGGGWLHLNDHQTSDVNRAEKPLMGVASQEISQ